MNNPIFGDIDKGKLHDYHARMEKYLLYSAISGVAGFFYGQWAILKLGDAPPWVYLVLGIGTTVLYFLIFLWDKHRKKIAGWFDRKSILNSLAFLFLAAVFVIMIQAGWDNPNYQWQHSDNEVTSEEYARTLNECRTRAYEHVGISSRQYAGRRSEYPAALERFMVACMGSYGFRRVEVDVGE